MKFFFMTLQMVLCTVMVYLFSLKKIKPYIKWAGSKPLLQLRVSCSNHQAFCESGRKVGTTQVMIAVCMKL